MQWHADKNTLRKSIREELSKLTKDRCAILSSRMANLLSNQQIWKQSKSVLSYIPLKTEPDLTSLLQSAISENKDVAALKSASNTIGYEPRFITDWSNDLVPGAYGILEPNDKCLLAPWNRLDLALIPGVAFDQFGRRLGKGKGYYDRALVHFPGIKIGVAFDEQMVEPGLIPMEPHDILMDWILTPSMILEVGSWTPLN